MIVTVSRVESVPGDVGHPGIGIAQIVGPARGQAAVVFVPGRRHGRRGQHPDMGRLGFGTLEKMRAFKNRDQAGSYAPVKL